MLHVVPAQCCWMSTKIRWIQLVWLLLPSGIQILYPQLYRLCHHRSSLLCRHPCQHEENFQKDQPHDKKKNVIILKIIMISTKSVIHTAASFTLIYVFANIKWKWSQHNKIIFIRIFVLLITCCSMYILYWIYSCCATIWLYSRQETTKTHYIKLVDWRQMHLICKKMRSVLWTCVVKYLTLADIYNEYRPVTGLDV